MQLRDSVFGRPDGTAMPLTLDATCIALSEKYRFPIDDVADTFKVKIALLICD